LTVLPRQHLEPAGHRQVAFLVRCVVELVQVVGRHGKQCVDRILTGAADDPTPRVAAVYVTHDGGGRRSRSVELAVDERALPESVEGHQAIREVGIQGPPSRRR
jgi:hypothetical protein